jgi:cell division protease FtsH
VLYGYDHSDAEVFLGRDFGTSKNYSENTASIIDEEIKSLIDNGYATALSILRAHMDKLVFVAEYLIKHESMDGDQFARAMQDGATEEDVLALAREKKEKSAEENKTAAAELKKKEEEEKVEAQTAEAVSDDTPSDDPPPSGDDIFRF